MKVRTFTSRLIQLNTYLPHFPPDLLGQLVALLPDDDIKKILYHAIPKPWKKKIVEQRYNYLDGPIHSMAEFYETRIEKFRKIDPTKCSLKKQECIQERVQEKLSYIP